MAGAAPLHLAAARRANSLRLSELVDLNRDAIFLGRGAHVRCLGKGRKERATPLTKLARTALQAWLKEPRRRCAAALFPNIHGSRLSPDSVQSLLSKYVALARTDAARSSPSGCRRTS